MCWCCGGRSVTRVRSLSRSRTGGRNFAKPQTRGDCSTALKFESSETVHESGTLSLFSRGAIRQVIQRRECLARDQRKREGRLKYLYELAVLAAFASSSTDSPKTKPASARIKLGSSFNPGINSNRRMPWWAASSRASMLISLRVST